MLGVKLLTKKFDDKNVFGFDLPKKTGEVKELTDMLRPLVDKANQNLRTLEKNNAEQISSAYQKWKTDSDRAGEFFSTNSWDVTELQRELARVQKFLSDDSRLVTNVWNELKVRAERGRLKGYEEGMTNRELVGLANNPDNKWAFSSSYWIAYTKFKQWYGYDYINSDDIKKVFDEYVKVKDVDFNKGMEFGQDEFMDILDYIDGYQ